MKFIEYARRRRMGYSINASLRFAQDSNADDMVIVIASVLVLVWLLVDSVSGLV